MKMTYVTGRSFLSDTRGTKNEGGDWKVVVTMTETLTYPNGTERVETIVGEYQDKEFHEAHKQAMRNVLQELQDIVYSRGFDSLIEARDYQRGLETDDITAKSDEAPASE